MSNPLVSIWCSAYNHQEYIAQAIESFVMQKTNFEVEIFVHDDASTDETAKIIREYAAAYPQIKPICLTENKFSTDKTYLNRIMFEKARGKYIAMCEGDDYWTDPLKIQKQVDFLEANPDFSICFHRTKILYEEDAREILSNENQKETTTFEDLALGNYIHTPSCMFRNKLFDNPVKILQEVTLGDWILHLLNANHGKIGYLKDVMAVYRIHKNGAWSMIQPENRILQWEQVSEKCYEYFYPRGKKQFRYLIAITKSDLCLAYFEKGDYENFRKKYKEYFRGSNEIIWRSCVAMTFRFLLTFVPFIVPVYKRILRRLKPEQSYVEAFYSQNDTN